MTGVSVAARSACGVLNVRRCFVYDVIGDAAEATTQTTVDPTGTSYHRYCVQKKSSTNEANSVVDHE